MCGSVAVEYLKQRDYPSGLNDKIANTKRQQQCPLLTYRDSFGLTWPYHNFQYSHFREARIILPENAESDPLAGYLQGADLRFDRRVIAALVLLILIALSFRVAQLGASPPRKRRG